MSQKEQQTILQSKEQILIQNLMLKKFKAVMLLAAVGDSIGYRRGKWQFNRDPNAIYHELLTMTQGKGISKLNVEPKNFPYSDDTVMHIATAKGLLNVKQQESSDVLLASIAKYYKKCMKYMGGRAPGNTCIRSAKKLDDNGSNWDVVRFEKTGGGCGASMRSACIGLLYSNNIQKLVQISIQSGRITHHNPLGYLGSVVSAYFTALAIQNIHPYLWYGKLMNQALTVSKEYLSNSRQSEENLGGDWLKFWQLWKKYGSQRKMQIDLQQEEKTVQPYFPQNYGRNQRQAFYHQFSLNGWPGALGVDSVIIAYDALISALHQKNKNKESNKWQQICLRGMLHGGDSDSTGTIVAAWYGACFGFDEVYSQNIQSCQGKQMIEVLGVKLYERWQSINK